MHTQLEITGPSLARASKDVETAMKEEDDFMIRHGWYMSCFYESWRNGRGRAVERKRAAERAKYVKLYKNSMICPDLTSHCINHRN